MNHQPPPVPSNNGNSLPLIQASQWLEAQESEWDVRRLLSVARRRGVVMVGVAVTVMSFVIPTIFNQEPVYQGKFRILVEPVDAQNDLSNLTAALGEEKLKSGLDYETQIQVLRSPELMALVIAQIQTTDPDIDYEYLMSGLTISRLGETKILEVRYRGENPQNILLTLEQLAAVYLEYSLKERQTNLRQGIQFVEKQLPFLQNRVNLLQSQLQAFRQQYQFTNPDSQAQQITSQITNLKQQNLALEQQLVQARSYLASLQGETGAVAALSDATVYQQIVSELRSVETQIAAELTRFQGQSTAIRLLQNQRQNLLPVLRQEAQRILGSKLAEAVTQVQILETQRQTLVVAQQQLEQQAGQIPALARQYGDLQREIQIATEGLNRFLATRETLQIQAARTEIPWEVIEAPILPNYSIFPNIRRSLTLGAVASVFLGLGAAFILEKLDNVYYTVEELKQHTKLPLLGTIPINKQLAQKQNNNLFTKTGSLFFKPFKWLIPTTFKQKNTPYGYYSNSQSSQFLEALRVLHTNIQLLSSDRPIRSLTISSAMPGDGKSTISIYLAQTAAAMGKKVLLVDADLRKPQVHPRLELPNQSGLSNLIAQNLSPEDVIEHKLPVANLSVLTAGKLPPDPAKLLSSQRMEQLMAGFSKTFDLVIYDTPPVVGLADASLLSPRTDGLILVTRIGKTDRSALSQALDNLKLSQIQVLGIVANALEGHSFGSYNYYKYGYGGKPEENNTDKNEELDSAFFN